MPELPEVETTVRQLKKNILGSIFIDVWTDWAKLIKKPKNFKDFKKEIKGRKIENIRRRAKYILFDLSDKKTLLVHQKMTGHFLVGKWQKKDNKWQAPAGPLSDKMNSYIHLMFFLNNEQMLAFSDVRKFGKVELWNTIELKNSKEIKKLGPELLDKKFTLDKLKERLKVQTREIKKVLMDQEVVAGIGNIYSDEILWQAKVSPLKKTFKLTESEIANIYKAIKEVLPLAIKLHGESISDYRVPSGERGNYDKARKVYRKEGEKCPRCKSKIKRVKIGGRSAHYCSNCQKA